MPRAPGDVPECALRMAMAERVGPLTAARLLAALGSPEAVVGATAKVLDAVMAGARGGVLDGAGILRALARVDPAAERAALEACGAGVVLLGDPDYPALLACTPDPPFALSVRGTLVAGDAWAVAIVGSRKATLYGAGQAWKLAAELSLRGLTIVSGGARGIDGAAHRAALQVGGRTIVVSGSGLGHCYPPEHLELFQQVVAAGGALVSEFPPRMPARAGSFPRRNRIIAGMAVGVLVVEAAEASGAMITARSAVEDLGREVMALPGQVTSRVSQGCHALIRAGAASLVRSS